MLVRDYSSMVGKTYGKLTVEEILPHETGKYRLCKCVCECGAHITVRVSNLLSGNTKTCRCTRGLKNRKDLSGQVYGRWTVISRIEDNDRHSKWLCKCACGVHKEVYQDNLISGKSVSCGCYAQEQTSKANTVDKTGMVIGRLRILHRVESVRGDVCGVKWKCECSCGNKVVLSTAQLDYRVSCGCAQHEKRTIRDITGQKFGKLTVLYRVDIDNRNGKYKKSTWLCQCECGNIVEVTRSNLISGNTRSCGCLDDRVNTKPVSQQQRWIHEQVGGEINYKFNSYFIDVALVEDKIAIEYDSHYWHQHTRERDDLRAHELLNSGWKVLRIMGVYLTPTADQLHEILDRFRNGPLTYKEIVLPDWEQRENADC